MKRLFSIVFIVFIAAFLKAANIDSLYQITQSGSDKEKADAYYKLSILIGKNQINKAIDYSEKGLEIAYQVEDEILKAKLHLSLGTHHSSIPDYEKTILELNKSIQIATKLKDDNITALAAYGLGKAYLAINDFEEAEDKARVAVELFSQSKNARWLASSYNLLALIADKSNKSTIALEYLLKAMDQAEASGNARSAINIQINIGNSYAAQNKLDESLSYFQKALELSQKEDYKLGLAAALNNIGDIHSRQKNYELAKAFFLRSIETDNTLYKRESASAYNNIGEVYQKMGKPFRSQEYYDKSLEISRRNKNLDKEVKTLMNLGRMHLELKNYKKANDYLSKCLVIGESLNSITILESAHRYLAQSYEERGLFKQALKYHKLCVKMSDSLDNIMEKDRLDELQLKYNLKQKEKKMDALVKDNKIKKLQILTDEQTKTIWMFIIIGVVILMVIVTFGAYFLYSRYNESKETNEKLSEKNSIIEKQRSRIVESINYAKRIQNSVLMPEDLIRNILPNSFIFYQPRDIVSGDLYWVNRIEDKIIIACADCTGHGVPGAFLTMITNMLLNRIVEEAKVTDPGAILKALDEGIIRTLKQDQYYSNSSEGLDISICVVDPREQMIHYAGAMNPIYVVQSHQLTALEPTIASIGGKNLRPGKTANKEFKVQSIPYGKDTSIYLLTDGYLDQFGGISNTKFNSNKFKEMLLEIYQNDMISQREIIQKRLENWMGNTRQLDDILVVGIRL